MGCSCSKKSQPTGFAASTPRTGAQAEQRAGATQVPGSISGPLRSVDPSGKR